MTGLGHIFKTASDIIQSRLEKRSLPTGSPSLDGLLGGVEEGGFYLFYGGEGGAPDAILLRLIVNCVKHHSIGGLDGRAFYLNCGNYKRGRTMLDVDQLFKLMEEARLDVSQASRRIYTICAFSEEQQMRALEEIERTVRGDPETRLIAVQQIAKLFTQPLATPRMEASKSLQNFVSRLKTLSRERAVILAASCRSLERREAGVPMPEGGNFLRHEANVIVYMHESGGVHTALMVKHPSRRMQGLKVTFDGGENVGRITPSTRQRIAEAMDSLRRTYRMAFRDESRKAAFDELWEAWASEEGAMIYSDLATVMDLLSLTAAVDNRRLIEEMRRELEEIKKGRG